MRILAWLFILILSVHGHAVCKNVTIGISLGLTGKYEGIGIMQKRGLLLWQSHVNAKGGLLGNPVKLIIEDDQSRPAMAKRIYTRLIEKQQVDLVIGPYSSGITEAVLPITENNRYPILLSGASADLLWEKGYKYVFGIYTPASKYTVGFLQLLVKKNIKKIAILSADNAFSKSLAQSTRKWAQRFKLSVVIFETFEEERKNLQDLAEKAKTSESGAIIVCGHLNESVRMRRALAAIDWYPKAYFASVGPATDKYRDLLKNEANLTFSASQWEKNVSIHFPRGKTFTDAFYDKYKMEPTYHAAAVYAAGMILEDVVKKGGTMNRETIRQILSNLNTLTVIGRYGVDSKGKQLRRFPLIIQWQNGEKKVVWPEKIKEASAMILE